MRPKTSQEIAKMRQGGKILAAILNSLAEMVRPGLRTVDLENEARRLTEQYKVKPSFLGYQGYPAVLCVSVNEEAVHAVPSGRVIKEGDIVSLDFGIWHEGLAVDAAVSIGAGIISSNAQKLINVTRHALEKAILKIRAGIKTGDIGSAIQNYVEDSGLNIVKELVGHGVGYSVHESPQIPNYGRAGTGVVLPENLVIAIEPIVTYGSGAVELAKDGFGYKSTEGELVAHFEATVVVKKDGAEVLTPL